MDGSGVGFIFHFLYFPVCPVHELDGKIRTVFKDNGTPLFQELTCPVCTGRHQGLPSTGHNCYHMFPFRLTPSVRHPCPVRRTVPDGAAVLPLPVPCGFFFQVFSILDVIKGLCRLHFPVPKKGCLTAGRRASGTWRISPGAYIFLYNGAVTLQFQQPGPLTYRAGLK